MKTNIDLLKQAKSALATELANKYPALGNIGHGIGLGKNGHCIKLHIENHCPEVHQIPNKFVFLGIIYDVEYVITGKIYAY